MLHVVLGRLLSRPLGITGPVSILGMLPPRVEFVYPSLLCPLRLEQDFVQLCHHCMALGSLLPLLPVVVGRGLQCRILFRSPSRLLKLGEL